MQISPVRHKLRQRLDRVCSNGFKLSNRIVLMLRLNDFTSWMSSRGEKEKKLEETERTGVLQGVLGSIQVTQQSHNKHRWINKELKNSSVVKFVQRRYMNKLKKIASKHKNVCFSKPQPHPHFSVFITLKYPSVPSCTVEYCHQYDSTMLWQYVEYVMLLSPF